MKLLRIAALSLLPAFAAATLLAQPRLCGSGLPPTLNGDLFSPAECSTATKTAPFLPGTPVVREGKEVKTGLKDLEGRWEGSLIHAMGRYAVLLTVKNGRGGKAELILDLKELQFRERLTDRLALVPAQGRGEYSAILTTTVAPDASLKGVAVIGAAAAPEGEPLSDRQADITFANGAVHRVVFSLKADKSELRVRAFSGVPGAPLQKFDLVLTKTKREAL